jgi:hypothetical protein
LVTPATIECAAQKIGTVWTLSNPAQSTRLRGLLKPDRTAQFSTQMVRVKISDRPEATYIDAEGAGSRGGAPIKIDKAEFTRFVGSLTPDERQVLDRGCD